MYSRTLMYSYNWMEICGNHAWNCQKKIIDYVRWGSSCDITEWCRTPPSGGQICRDSKKCGSGRRGNCLLRMQGKMRNNSLDWNVLYLSYTAWGMNDYRFRNGIYTFIWNPFYGSRVYRCKNTRVVWLHVLWHLLHIEKNTMRISARKYAWLEKAALVN